MSELRYIKQITYFIFFTIPNTTFWLVSEPKKVYFSDCLQLFMEGENSVELCTAVHRFCAQSVALYGKRRKCSHCVLNLVTSGNFDDY